MNNTNMVAEVDKLMSLMNSLDSKLGKKDKSEKNIRRYHPRRGADKELGIGVVAEVHSLQSARGQTLNGKRCILLEFLTNDQRWKVQVQDEPTTTALKVVNLKLPELPKNQPHPDYMEMTQFVMTQHARATHEGKPREEKYHSARGVAYDNDPPQERARKLVELLDYEDYDTKYEPNQTILYGVACQCYGIVPESSLMNLTMTELEQLAALMALGGMCQGELSGAVGCGRMGRPDAVVFALLEAAPLSLDVLLGFLVVTPFIGPQELCNGDKQNQFRSCRGSTNTNFADWNLTPNQTHLDYCTAMRGPLGILSLTTSLCKGNKSSRLDRALLHRIQQHPLLPKVLQRLCRFAASEIMGVADGMDLGQYVRTILANMADWQDNMDTKLYNSLVSPQATWGIPKNKVAEQFLRNGDNLKSFAELYDFLLTLLLLPQDQKQS